MGNDEEKMQELYMRLQLLGNTIKQLQKQIQLSEEQALELNSVKENIAELGTQKESEPVLIPVAGGIFAKGRLEKADELFVNVGAQVMVKKDAKGTQDFLDQKVLEVLRSRKEMMDQLEQISSQAVKLQEELSGLINPGA